jgi:hypothetical protein
MSEVNRRAALQGAAILGAALVGQGIARGREPSRESDALPSPAEAFAKMKLSAEQRKRVKLFASSAHPPISFVGDQQKLDVTKLTPTVRQILDGNKAAITTALHWTCVTDKLNDLHIDENTPLVAQTFSFSVDNISWQAGAGWPVYHVYCPRDDYGDMYYRDAKVHQIVPAIVGVNYFIGCASSATCAGSKAGQVRFAVNDGSGDYGDNHGTFDVWITSWS